MSMDSDSGFGGDFGPERKSLGQVMERYPAEMPRLFRAVFGKSADLDVDPAELICAIVDKMNADQPSAVAAVVWSKKSRSWVALTGGSGTPVASKPPEELRTEISDFFEARWV